MLSSCKFTTSNLGWLTWYTDYAFKRDLELGTLEITLKALIESVLNHFGVGPSSDTHTTPGVKVGRREEDEPRGDWPYREAVGRMISLSTMTRIDISNAVRAVMCHSHSPTDRHWKAVTKILVYIHRTRSYRLTFVRDSGLELTVYIAVSYTHLTLPTKA